MPLAAPDRHRKSARISVVSSVNARKKAVISTRSVYFFALLCASFSAACAVAFPVTAFQMASSSAVVHTP